MDVIGVGALNVDLFYEVPDLSIAGRRFEPGGQAFLDEASFTEVSDDLGRRGKLVGRSGGGSAANTVAALSRMGYDTGFLGVVGKDDHGKFLLRSMEGADTSRVKKFQKSGMCVSMLHGGDRSLLVLPNANEYFSFTEDDVGFLNSSKFVHLSSFAGDNPLNAQKRLVEQLDDQVYVSFAPGERYARRGLKQMRELVARSRILFVNDREVELLTGLGPKEGSRALLDVGPNVVACTRGERGSWIITKNSEIEVPAKRTVVVDKTGAGDVYAAGFLAGYLDGATLEVCGEIASAAAALSIASYGRSGYPDERFLRSYASELA
jgi:sugar/nucleoside kinase (ribokinase family)